MPTSAPGLDSSLPASAPGLAGLTPSAPGSDSFSPASAPGLGSSPPTSAAGLNRRVADWTDPLPHPHQDWAHPPPPLPPPHPPNASFCTNAEAPPARIRTRTGLPVPTAAPGLNGLTPPTPGTRLRSNRPCWDKLPPPPRSLRRQTRIDWPRRLTRVVRTQSRTRTRTETHARTHTHKHTHAHARTCT